MTVSTNDSKAIKPLDWQGDAVDFEVYGGHGAWEWVGYYRAHRVSSGRSRTLTGLRFGMWCCERRFSRARRRHA